MRQRKDGKVDMNGMRFDWGMAGCPIDEHGNAVARTKTSHPYTYDGFVLHRMGENKEAESTIYSDRLMQWDFKKHDELLMKHFGDQGQYWNRRDVKGIEAFLRDWCEDPELKLILVMEYCNQSSGYPCWRFDFAYGPAKRLAIQQEIAAGKKEGTCLDT
jgi:hypothetical protein